MAVGKAKSAEAGAGAMLVACQLAGLSALIATMLSVALARNRAAASSRPAVDAFVGKADRLRHEPEPSAGASRRSAAED